MAVAATYDVSTDIGKVRLRIPDRDVKKPLFVDAELQVFLDDNGGNVLLATAEALEAIAGDPRRLRGYSRGGVRVEPQLASDLRERAQQLRDAAEQDVLRDGNISFGVVERDDFW